MCFERLPAIRCLGCGHQHDTLPMDTLLAVGFGYAGVTKDGAAVYTENFEGDETTLVKFWRCQDAENAARQDPDHDWRIHLVGPLSERHYQRQGEDHWVLYEKGIGFA